MLEIIEQPKKQKAVIIKMGHMKPGQIGQIHGSKTPDFVMRTLSTDKFEVINLTQFANNKCWTNIHCDLKVRLLNPDESLIIKLSN